MAIAPLEYLVIRVQARQFAREIVPMLTTIQKTDSLRVVDLLFVSKDATGAVTLQEVHELGDEDLSPFSDLVDDLQGLLTAEDIATLATDLPVGEEAVVVLLEHLWTRRKSNGSWVSPRRDQAGLPARGFRTAASISLVNTILALIARTYQAEADSAA